VLLLVGLFFCAGIYPIATTVWHPGPSDDPGDMMMLSLYFALGIFLLLAARRPAEHRSLIAFAGWSSFAHAAVMSTLGIHMPSERAGFWIGSGVLVVIGVVLLGLLPNKTRIAAG
jgi:hypothetical protein